jgi:hypothetical protein
MTAHDFDVELRAVVFGDADVRRPQAESGKDIVAFLQGNDRLRKVFNGAGALGQQIGDGNGRHEFVGQSIHGVAPFGMSGGIA